MSLQEDVKVKNELKKPSLFKVVLLNDDYTDMDFVVEILIDIFHKQVSEAVNIMLSVHEQGRGICGVYTKEIAETKVAQVELRANENEFPLKAIIEEA